MLLIEADPTGGSAIAAGYLRGSVTPPEGMIELALGHQNGRLLDALARMSEDLPGTAARFVSGTRSHAQARSLVGLWEPLADALRSLEDTGQDVIVDGGRLGLFGSPEPLVAAADLALLVTRTDLVSLAGARSWAETLHERFARDGATASLGVLLVGEGAPFRAREVARVLRVPVLSSVAWDPAGAATLSHGAEPPQARRWHRWVGRTDWTDSPLMGSLRATRSAITGAIRANAERIDTTGRGRHA
ncbi:MAG: hypothetical protein KQH57_11840 [Actinomycetales bacterium]|nr:hypothetical protein [Actinomycetales bacterium]